MKTKFLQRVLWLMIPLLTLISPNTWGGVNTGDLFERLDAAPANGDEVIIVNASETYALSTTQNNNNRGQQSISVNNHQYIYASSSVQVLTIKKDGSNYGFHTGSGFLQQPSNNNYLRTTSEAYSASLANATKWTLSVTSSVFTIKSVRNTSYYLQYNSGNSIFSSYKNTQAHPSIYKKVCSAPTALTKGTITANSVELTITDGADVNDYEIYHSTSSTAPTASSTATKTTTSKSYTLDGLSANTTYYVWVRSKCSASRKTGWIALTGNSFKTSAASCTTNATVSAGSLKGSVSSSSEATAQCTGGITSLGSAGCSITSYGFAVGTSTNPTIGGTLTGTGKTYEVGTSYTTVNTAFEKLIDGLSASTKYYVRPYATNGNGTAYGSEFNFTTLAACTAAPTVTAGSTGTVTSTTAVVNCSSGLSALGTGGCTVTSYGFVYGTSENPTTSNSTNEVGTSYTTTGTSFNTILTSLTEGQLYYVRPYATNGYGTGYGTQTSFGTPKITTSLSTRNFGDRKVNGGPYTMTFKVSGVYLQSDISIAKSGTNQAMFSIDKATISQTDGTAAETTITVSYSPTAAGSHSATLTLTSTNATSKTVTLTGTGVYVDTFIDVLQSTTGYTEGSPHTESSTYSTPTLNDKSVATSGTCEQQHYHFVGWITAAKYAAGTAISDGDLQTPTTASNATYYAVWAKQAAGGGSTTKTWTFSAPVSNLAYNTETSDTQDGLTWKYKAYYNTTANPAMTGIQLNSCSSTRASYFYIPGYNSLSIESIAITASASVTFKVVSNQPTTSDSQSALVEASGTSATLDCSSLSPKIQSCYIKVTGSVQVQEVEVTYNSISYTDYKAICCTDWSTPTVTYSSSLAINASEGVTIGSGTTHGAVTYESSDEDVLTVDADGTIHAVGAGTAHIIATWAGDATYCEKSANSNDVTVSGIQVTGTTPVNFGQVYQNAAVANKTIYVTGLGLASPITPSLPVGSPFSFSPASLAKDCSGATLTISASTATLGTYNQTLTLTSGAFSATVTVKMEVIAKPTATFTDALHELTTDKNGASLNSFNLEAAQGTPVVFPTLANQTKSAGTCEGEYYIFVGWTEGDNNTDPQDHLVTSHTLANGDAKHYYAVWADGTSSASYTKLTSNSFSGTPAKYVLGAEYSGTTYYFSSYSDTDTDLSWGTCSSSDAPIQFTLSGTAGALVAQDASGNYLAESSAKKKFRMSSTSTTVELQDDGTIETEYFYLRYNHNSGAGGLRFYETAGSEPVYFYLVGAAGTVHYRTSCCANKVDAPVVTATKTSTTITLTWPDDAKATGWQVEWNGAGGWVAPTSTCTYAKTGLTPNTTYTWRVRATYEDPVCGADVRSGSTTTNQVYHVTYLGGSGTGSCSPSKSTTDATGYEAGATVTLQSNGFSLAGHVFNAWTTDDPDVVISSNQFTMPDHDVVITATWTAKADKYFDRMHDQTDASHGGVAETEGTNEGKYYILKEGCSYSVPTAVDSKTGDACQTSHYKLRGWIAASYVNSKGEITDESKIFSPGTTKTAGGYTYYAVWAEVTE